MLLSLTFLFVVSLSSANDYYNNIDWSTAPSASPLYQEFHPSSKFDASYLDEDTFSNDELLDYSILATNLLEPDDIFTTNTLNPGNIKESLKHTNHIISVEVDRLVGTQVEDVVPAIGGLAPFVATTALILGVR